MNYCQHSRRVVKVEQVRRGAGHVRKVTLECGHSKETMQAPKQLRAKMVCEACRREA
jgi:hypothetical protein